jgi:hypothetical protein
MSNPFLTRRLDRHQFFFHNPQYQMVQLLYSTIYPSLLTTALSCISLTH